MTEIEFSAISQLCLQQQIPTQAQLTTEILELIAERSANQDQVSVAVLDSDRLH